MLALAAVLGVAAPPAATLSESTTLATASAAAAKLCNPGCPWDPLTVGCTTPKLDLSFTKNIYHYSGVVECGNLFMDADLGAQAAVQYDYAPYVSFPTAKTGSLYTLMMFDPDANMNGSYPFVVEGSLSVIRHWVVGNIKGSALAAGFDGAKDYNSATVVTPFASPGPPIGSHRYAQFLFEQPGTDEIAFATLNNQVGSAGTERFNWDVSAFISEYSLGTPVASNWFIAMHSPTGYTPS